MVLSTTKPVEMIRAIKEKLSSEKPSIYMMPKVPKSASGTDTAGTRVARQLRKNKNTTSTTRMVESTRVISTSFTELRIEVVVSWITVKSMAGGSTPCCNCGIMALMA